MGALQAEVAEAICSALYTMPFSEFLGEDESSGGFTSWFHLGQTPQDIRVRVIRLNALEAVQVVVEWVNRHGPEPVKGSQSLMIGTLVGDRGAVEAPTQDAVLRILAIFKDVLEGTGVAGSIEALAPAVEETEEDEDA